MEVLGRGPQDCIFTTSAGPFPGEMVRKATGLSESECTWIRHCTCTDPQPPTPQHWGRQDEQTEELEQGLDQSYYGTCLKAVVLWRTLSPDGKPVRPLSIDVHNHCILPNEAR